MKAYRRSLAMMGRVRTKLEPLAFLWRQSTHGPGPAGARQREAYRQVRLHTTLSVPGSLVPIPYSDVVLVTALQLRMLSRITSLYGIPFSANKGRLLISALLLGLPQGLSNALVGATLTARSLSVVAIGPGTFASALILGTLGATVTFALGQVFIEHFESGGTLLDLDPESAAARLAVRLSAYGSKVPHASSSQAGDAAQALAELSVDPSRK